jgi:signal transduction histidine kinase
VGPGRPRLSIPAKLLLVSSVLVAPPWLAVRLVRELQLLVLEAQEQALAETARRAAVALGDRPGLLPLAASPPGTLSLASPSPGSLLPDSPAPDALAPDAPSSGADARPWDLPMPEAITTDSEEHEPAPLPRSPEIDALLDALGGPRTRLWLVDVEKHVVAQAGSLDAADAHSGEPATAAGARRRVLEGLLRRLVRTSRVETTPSPPGSHEVDLALMGEPATRWRAAHDGTVVLAAAHPVRAAGRVRGAVLVQETASELLRARGRSFDAILGGILVASALAALALVAFSVRLSFRVRRLRDAVDDLTASARGLEPSVPDAHSRDELGALSRSVLSLAARQREHAAYLEQVGRRLSHELRTPVGVVRSSLDNLRQAPSPEGARIYLERAEEGLRRLALILARMGEAARLEQALAATEREAFDLVPVVRGSVAGYLSAHPGCAIALREPGEPLPVLGAPDLLAQALDKLLDNALSFAAPGSAVEVELHRYGRAATLSVRNEGPPLPAEMSGRLFESMVSVRPRGAGTTAVADAGAREPHLGLGLYVVRLVAEFHGGAAAAHDRPDGRGVIVTLTLPLAT